jgi:hypothetical protein
MPKSVMLLAEYEDVVTESFEANRGMPHVLRHLDPFSDLVLTLVEEIFRSTPCAYLLSFQDAVDAITNPPDVTSRLALPEPPDWFPLPRHNEPSITRSITSTLGREKASRVERLWSL